MNSVPLECTCAVIYLLKPTTLPVIKLTHQSSAENPFTKLPSLWYYKCHVWYFNYQIMNMTQRLCCPTQLRPHPRNSAIYGDEDIIELVELIRQSGWIKPLVVTPADTIISGHRRWKAALSLELESVPVEVRKFPDELTELEALLLENASRFKTTEQKVREAQAWRELEETRAKLRKVATQNNDAGRAVMENFPHLPTSKGTTRDAIASRVGLGSGRTYSKAAKVVSQIDEEASLGHLEIAQVLRKVLNEQSVDAAHTLLKKSPEERQAIANLIANGEAKSTFHARQVIRRNNYTGLSNPSQIPSLSQFQVGALVFVDIDRREAASPQEKNWNGFWGIVTQIGEMGSLAVNVGSESLRLFSRDLKPIDLPSKDLRDVVSRLLKLRSLELDEIEERMLDVIQRREWLTSKQLIHLDNIEKLYPLAESMKTEEQQPAQCRSP